jgi:hypothetical protein
MPRGRFERPIERTDDQVLDLLKKYGAHLRILAEVIVHAENFVDMDTALHYLEVHVRRAVEANRGIDADLRGEVGGAKMFEDQGALISRYFKLLSRPEPFPEPKRSSFAAPEP